PRHFVIEFVDIGLIEPRRFSRVFLLAGRIESRALEYQAAREFGDGFFPKRLGSRLVSQGLAATDVAVVVIFDTLLRRRLVELFQAMLYGGMPRGGVFRAAHGVPIQLVPAIEIGMAFEQLGEKRLGFLYLSGIEGRYGLIVQRLRIGRFILSGLNWRS